MLDAAPRLATSAAGDSVLDSATGTPDVLTPRQNQELLRLCIDAAPVGIAMFDRDMRYLAASRRFCQDRGLSGHDLVGRSHYELFPQISESWRESHRRCLAGKPERCDADPFRHPNGSIAWYRWEIRPWYEAPGVVGGIVLFNENISQRVAAEAKSRQWADAFENAAIGIAIQDAVSGHITIANQPFAAVCRTDVATLCGTSLVDAFPAEDRERITRLLAAADSGGRAVGEVVQLHQDDGTISAQIIINSVPGRGGRVHHRIASVLDITERRRAETALKESEITTRRTAQLLDKTVASMADAVLVLDAAGRMLFANPACQVLLGDNPDLGSEAWQRTFRRFGPDGVTPFPAGETPMARAVRGENFDDVEIVIRRQGEARRNHLVANGRAIRDESGRHVASVIVYRDVTELTEKTAAAQRYAELFEKTIASIPDAFLVTDENKVVLLSNPACHSLIGIRPGVLPAEWAKSHRFLAPDGLAPVAPERRPIDRVLRGDPIDNEEFVLRDETRGRDLHLAISGRPIRDSQGAIRGAVLLYRDTTRAKEIERQLRQAQKMEAIGQLTGGIAHDFNNLLTVITGTIEILIDALADRPQLHGIAKMIDKAATRGADLTSQLLSFARRQPLQPRRTDVNALVAETAKLLRPALGAHVEITTVLENGAWPAMIDPSQLSNAIINLAINGRDAMPAGGKLILQTGNVMLDADHVRLDADVRPGPYVLIAVSDSGDGIPADVRDKVFEPFFTTKGVGEGTGLGLSMVYGFVKQSGGHITLYSEVGHGTTVKLYLPRSADRASDIAPEGAAPVIGGSETILVVEDDDLVRDHVVAQLRGLGYATWSAGSGGDALALVDAGIPFDLLFTDVALPGGMNGRRLAEEVTRRRPSVKVLYSSGFTENAIVHHGRLDAGVALLAKPYRRADLARKIREMLDRRPGSSAG